MKTFFDECDEETSQPFFSSFLEKICFHFERVVIFVIFDGCRNISSSGHFPDGCISKFGPACLLQAEGIGNCFSPWEQIHLALPLVEHQGITLFREYENSCTSARDLV